MSNAKTIAAIRLKLQRLYPKAEIVIGYHARELPFLNFEPERGCFAEITYANGAMFRIYALSYSSLLNIVQEK